MASISAKSFTDRSGQPYTIRTANADDAEALLAYIQQVADDTNFFVLEPDEFPR